MTNDSFPNLTFCIKWIHPDSIKGFAVKTFDRQFTFDLIKNMPDSFPYVSYC